MLKAYAKKYAKFMQGPVVTDVESWIREAVMLTLSASVEAFDELSRQNPAKRDLWRKIIINRILRGVLWTIHNGNAPGRDFLSQTPARDNDRTLECCLSSKWLQGNDIVYIS